MKPAEIITVAVSIPLIAALMVSEMTASQAPASAVRTADVTNLAPVSTAAANEIVIVARRASKG